MAFIAAPDVYFLPIITGLLGLIMTSAQGNTVSKLLYANATRKIRRIELRITATVYRMKYLDRRRYNKYVYPVMALSIPATAILLYYSLIIKSYYVGGYEFYYHPYHFGSDGLTNDVSTTILLFFDFILISFMASTFKPRTISLIFVMSFLAGIAFMGISVALTLGYPVNFPEGLRIAYSQSMEFPGYGFFYGSLLVRTQHPKIQKKASKVEEQRLN